MGGCYRTTCSPAVTNSTTGYKRVTWRPAPASESYSRTLATSTTSPRASTAVARKRRPSNSTFRPPPSIITLRRINAPIRTVRLLGGRRSLLMMPLEPPERGAPVLAPGRLGGILSRWPVLSVVGRRWPGRRRLPAAGGLEHVEKVLRR